MLVRSSTLGRDATAPLVAALAVHELDSVLGGLGQFSIYMDRVPQLSSSQRLTNRYALSGSASPLDMRTSSRCLDNAHMADRRCI